MTVTSKVPSTLLRKIALLGLLIAPCVLSCSEFSSSDSLADAGQSSQTQQGQLSIEWPIESGVTSYVTQSPTKSGQGYPCGSGVNGRHIIHSDDGVNADYLQSLDIVAGSPVPSGADNDGRGTDVVAVAAGRVVALNFSQNECDSPFGAGNYVILEHPQKLIDGKPLRSAYLHLNSNQGAEQEASCNSNPAPSHVEDVDLQLGSLVTQGQKLGELGNTGNSTGPHLHFQFATDCILEPADQVHCPSIGVFAVNSQGFSTIETRRDDSCPKVATGGPLQMRSNSTYLSDGTYVMSAANHPAAVLALASIE